MEAVDEFTRLYEEHRRPLFLFCLARLGDAELAEDVVQDSFVKAFLLHHRYDESRPYWPWLASIAARECIRAHRRRAAVAARMGRLAHEPLVEPADPTAAAVIEQLEQLRLRRAVAELPARQGIALHLFAVKGFSYAEIAAHLGGSIAAVRTLIMRGRARLREQAASSSAGLVGVSRVLRWWRRRMTGPLEAAIAAWTGHLASLAPLAARASVMPVLVMGTAAALPQVTGPSTVTVGSVAELAGGAAAVLPADATRPWSTTTGFTWDEPPLHGHQAAVERAVNEQADPVLFGSAHDVPPEKAPVHTVAVSPAYGKDDHTVFVSTSYSSLPLLYVSHNGGARWQRLRALGFAGAKRLLLPPAYPRDPRIFALGIQGLQMSRDGGDTFETVLAGGGMRGVGGAMAFLDASLPPTFGPDHPVVVLVGGGTVFEYHLDTGDLQPVTVEEGTSYHQVDMVRYGPPSEGGATLFLSSVRMAETSSDLTEKYPESRLLRCTRGERAATPAPGSPLQPVLRCTQAQVPGPMATKFMSLMSEDDAVFGVDAFDIRVSVDGGRSFQRRTPWPEWGGGYAFVNDITVARQGGTTMAYAAIVDWGQGIRQADVLRTRDLGRTWDRLPIDLPGFENGAKTVQATPTGRIVALGAAYGIACSVDGITWATTCPTPDAA